MLAPAEAVPLDPWYELGEMQDPIDRLMEEHRLIEAVLAALRRFALGVPEPRPEERERLAQFVDFLSHFADKEHHGKEEDVLFVAMVEAGMPQQTGPIACMLHEHDEGRAHVAALGQLASQPQPWTAQEREAVGRHALDFVQLLTAHIQKEDQVLYPMARDRLSEAQWQQVSERARIMDADHAALGQTQRLQQLGRSLSEGCV